MTHFRAHKGTWDWLLRHVGKQFMKLLSRGERGKLRGEVVQLGNLSPGLNLGLPSLCKCPCPRGELSQCDPYPPPSSKKWGYSESKSSHLSLASVAGEGGDPCPLPEDGPVGVRYNYTWGI